MSRIVLWMSISIDGYAAGTNGELAWQQVDDEVHAHFNDVLRDVSAFVTGRVTWQLMADFWPTADEDPAASAPVKEFARIWRDKPKVVFSQSIEHVDWNTTVRTSVTARQIADLRSRFDGDLTLGGADLAQTFLRMGEVDELRLYVHPVVLGQGMPLFRPRTTSMDLRLLDTHGFGNGVVLLHYEVC